MNFVMDIVADVLWALAIAIAVFGPLVLISWRKRKSHQQASAGDVTARTGSAVEADA